VGAAQRVAARLATKIWVESGLSAYGCERRLAAARSRSRRRHYEHPIRVESGAAAFERSCCASGRSFIEQAATALRPTSDIRLTPKGAQKLPIVPGH
jgi:hypothetical protein